MTDWNHLAALCGRTNSGLALPLMPTPGKRSATSSFRIPDLNRTGFGLRRNPLCLLIAKYGTSSAADMPYESLRELGVAGNPGLPFHLRLHHLRRFSSCHCSQWYRPSCLSSPRATCHSFLIHIFVLMEKIRTITESRGMRYAARNHYACPSPCGSESWQWK